MTKVGKTDSFQSFEDIYRRCTILRPDEGSTLESQAACYAEFIPGAPAIPKTSLDSTPHIISFYEKAHRHLETLKARIPAEDQYQANRLQHIYEANKANPKISVYSKLLQPYGIVLNPADRHAMDLLQNLEKMDTSQDPKKSDINLKDFAKAVQFYLIDKFSPIFPGTSSDRLNKIAYYYTRNPQLYQAVASYVEANPEANTHETWLAHLELDGKYLSDASTGNMLTDLASRNSYFKTSIAENYIMANFRSHYISNQNKAKELANILVVDHQLRDAMLKTKPGQTLSFTQAKTVFDEAHDQMRKNPKQPALIVAADAAKTGFAKAKANEQARQDRQLLLTTLFTNQKYENTPVDDNTAKRLAYRLSHQPEAFAVLLKDVGSISKIDFRIAQEFISVVMKQEHENDDLSTLLASVKQKWNEENNAVVKNDAAPALPQAKIDELTTLCKKLNRTQVREMREALIALVANARLKEFNGNYENAVSAIRNELGKNYQNAGFGPKTTALLHAYLTSPHNNSSMNIAIVDDAESMSRKIRMQAALELFNHATPNKS